MYAINDKMVNLRFKTQKLPNFFYNFIFFNFPSLESNQHITIAHMCIDYDVREEEKRSDNF